MVVEEETRRGIVVMVGRRWCVCVCGMVRKREKHQREFCTYLPAHGSVETHYIVRDSVAVITTRNGYQVPGWTRISSRDTMLKSTLKFNAQIYCSDFLGSYVLSQHAIVEGWALGTPCRCRRARIRPWV